jgi:hypothetical protein
MFARVHDLKADSIADPDVTAQWLGLARRRETWQHSRAMSRLK